MKTPAMSFVLLTWLGAIGAGCGPSAQLVAARDTVAASARTITEADVAVSEARRTQPESATLEAASEAFTVAAAWQVRMESMISVWEQRGSGERGYRLYTGCLRGALERMVGAFAAAELGLPADTDQTIQLYAGEGRTDCADPE